MVMYQEFSENVLDLSHHILAKNEIQGWKGVMASIREEVEGKLFSGSGTR